MGAFASQLCGKPTQIAPSKGENTIDVAYNDKKARLPGTVEEPNVPYGSYTDNTKTSAVLANNGTDNSPKIAAVQQSSGSINNAQADAYQNFAQQNLVANNGTRPSGDERVPVLILWDWASRKIPDLISVYKADEFCSFLKMELTTEGRLLYKLIVVLEASEVIELANKDAQYIFNNLVGSATVLVADGQASRAAYFKKELDNFLSAHERCMNEPRVVFLGADFGLGQRVLDSSCELVLIMDRKKNKPPPADDIWNDKRLSNYARIKWATVNDCFKHRRSNTQHEHEVLIEAVPGHTAPKRRLAADNGGHAQFSAASNGGGNAVSMVSTVHGTRAANAAAVAAKEAKVMAERQQQSTYGEVSALLPMHGSTGDPYLQQSPISSATQFSNGNSSVSPANDLMNDGQSLSDNLQAMFASAGAADNGHSSKLAATRERIRQNTGGTGLKRIDTPALSGPRASTPSPALYSDPSHDPNAAGLAPSEGPKPPMNRKLAPIPELPTSAGGAGELDLPTVGGVERKSPWGRGNALGAGPPLGFPRLPGGKPAPIAEAVEEGVGCLETSSWGGDNTIGAPRGLPLQPSKPVPMAEVANRGVGGLEQGSSSGRVNTLGYPLDFSQPSSRKPDLAAESMETTGEPSTSYARQSGLEGSGKCSDISCRRPSQDLIFGNASGTASEDYIHSPSQDLNHLRVGEASKQKCNSIIDNVITLNEISNSKMGPNQARNTTKLAENYKMSGVRHVQSENTHRNGITKRCLNRVARALHISARRLREEEGDRLSGLPGWEHPWRGDRSCKGGCTHGAQMTAENDRLAGLPGWEYPWRGGSSQDGGCTHRAQAVAESLQSGDNARSSGTSGKGRAALVLWDIENCHLIEGDGKNRRLAATAASIRSHLDSQFLSTASPSSLRLVTAVSTQSLHFNRVVCGYRGFVSDLCTSGVDLVLAAARKEHPPSLKSACAALQLAPATIINKASKRDADVILKKELDLFIDLHATSAQTSPKSERPLIVHISSDEDFVSSLERAARLGFDIILLQNNAIESVVATVRVAGGTCGNWRDFRAAAAAMAKHHP